jgi:hypothetical protein
MNARQVASTQKTSRFARVTQTNKAANIGTWSRNGPVPCGSNTPPTADVDAPIDLSCWLRRFRNALVELFEGA